MNKIILPILYAAPIGYFILLLQDNEIVFEKHENFVKSSFRNRSYISGPNGVLRLSIPIRGGKGKHQKYNEVIVDNSQEWQKNHWQSLASSYRSSPYFEFYEDELVSYYSRPVGSLFEFNMSLFGWILKKIQLEIETNYTISYEAAGDFVDYRNEFKKLKTEGLAPYNQVFQKKFGFLPGLSIFDLLFNLGPETLSYLENAEQLTKS